MKKRKKEKTAKHWRFALVIPAVVLMVPAILVGAEFIDLLLVRGADLEGIRVPLSILLRFAGFLIPAGACTLLVAGFIQIWFDLGDEVFRGAFFVTAAGAAVHLCFLALTLGAGISPDISNTYQLIYGIYLSVYVIAGIVVAGSWFVPPHVNWRGGKQ